MYDDWMRRAARAVEDAVARLDVGTERDNAGPSLFVYLTSTRYASLVFADVVGKDFQLVAPALAIIVLLLLLHTHSPLLSIAAVLQVFIAFAMRAILFCTGAKCGMERAFSCSFFIFINFYLIKCIYF